ncbi:Crp/Fnr family transcriptional regulator [Pedobacter nototheniae]|uniref:Crp/Fnr family transcriptional regulator n=1 Tax=Pedobacter nototheniae TaxID=2488994 RepID=UPI00292CF3AF|nr:Crp/Fnr family transcriptional regulator [Pedobacter nototheniae]
MFSPFNEGSAYLQPYWEKYMALHKRVELPARTVLLNEGEISKRSFLIEKGCIRAWFNNQGNDTTFQFFFENEIFSSRESFKKNIPSICTFETIEPSVVHIIEKKDFEQIMAELDKDTTFLKQMLDVLFERQFHYMKEFLSMIRDTPEQRYLNLLNDAPYVIKRVPQHYIASYLGVSSVHLSRLKSKLLKEKKI